MNLKSNLVLIIIAVIVMIAAKLFFTRFLDLKDENRRLKNNEIQLVAFLNGKNSQIYSLEFDKKEMEDFLKYKYDSVLKLLKIQPKEIKIFVDRKIFELDTVLVPVKVIKDKIDFLLADSGVCWHWKARLSMLNDSPVVRRTLFEYKNGVQDYFYSRRKHKCWFIRYGKKMNYRRSVYECGGEEVKAINVFRVK